MILLSGIVGIIAICSGIIYVRLILKPLTELKTAVEKFKDGNLRYRAKKVRNDEAGELTCSFNLMADEIEMAIEKNEQTRKQQLNTRMWF